MDFSGEWKKKDLKSLPKMTRAICADMIAAEVSIEDIYDYELLVGVEEKVMGKISEGDVLTTSGGIKIRIGATVVRDDLRLYKLFETIEA